MIDGPTAAVIDGRAVPRPPASASEPRARMVALALGPLLALALWFAPLPVPPTAKHAMAITALLVVYWMAEPIDHGLTALLGGFLFWSLNVSSFQVAFSGFADSTPWFVLGGMLMGEAASKSGLARRVGYLVLGVLGTSYSQLLLSVIILLFVLNFVVPAQMAQVALAAPMLMGIVATFGVGPRSNIGRGLFIILTYTCGLFSKMVLAGATSILARGIFERMTGATISWTEYFIAYLPADLVTIVACWLTILWLYPPEVAQLPGGRRSLLDARAALGPVSRDEKKVAAWLLLAIALWSTDFLHHLNPAIVALGSGLVLALPGLGVLKTEDVRRLNFLMVIFVAGALGMGSVLMETKALTVLTDVMMSWMEPLLGSSFQSAVVLYWAGFFYHFILASELSMLSTSLPLIIDYASTHGFNPLAFTMIWTFAAGGKLFVYQSSVMMIGYSYGYFEPKDLLKVGLVLTIVEGIVLFVLVPLYWPLIGIAWTK